MQSGVISCPVCGTKSVADLRYCRQCGARLEAVMRALRQEAAPGAAPHQPDDSAGRPHELAVLLTASVALVVFLATVFTIGLGLLVAGKLGSLGTVAWLCALVAPCLALCYFWMRRWTRGRTAKADALGPARVPVRGTTRMEINAEAPTLDLGALHDTADASLPETRRVDPDTEEETRRISDNR